MDTKKLFARVCEILPLDQNDFLGFLGDAVRFFYARYGDAIAQTEKEVTHTLSSTDDGTGVDPIFFDALLNYVLFLSTKDTERRTFAIIEADYAYRTLWRRDAAGLRLKRGRW